MNVDVSVGVGGKWTRGVRRRDGHAANGNGSTGGSSVGSSKRGLRMGRGDMYGGTRGSTLCVGGEASPGERLREAEREGEEMRLADKRDSHQFIEGPTGGECQSERVAGPATEPNKKHRIGAQHALAAHAKGTQPPIRQL